MDILLNDFQDFSLWLVSHDHLNEVSSFILRVNHQVHLNSNIINYSDLLKTRKLDLDSYSSSFFYAIKNRKHEIVGTIKAQKWDGNSRLPIEDDFDVKVVDVLNELSYTPHEVWHIGRFAIDQQRIKTDPFLRKNRVVILKLLMVNALQHIYANLTNILIAECDKKLFDKLRLMEIYSSQIGDSKFYLGSETVPMFNTAIGVKKFVEQHIALCYSYQQQDLYTA
ncbi:hypothetical protein DWB61_02775 [Ancylomarina euxinus]|uniref:GNAT family N-acetyltransferase n=1 Tax=Ancylomarina euxinus TaxID=2283627 RepID=A0A425Y6C1_9BACT|nr:hypothetical protein [Ancylomarina euxinus]MCZ4694073.1 hypothetical protein [Ancylomarina euxinus]MUP14507.1 hypothetical protein [Ancylomarina euxinus]RRG24057.1 hypothetical protein DWB61_02775 [Ancylomarina euxinus]